MMNGVDSGCGGPCRGGSAGSHASQLAKMRVAAPHLASPGPSPSTPITPVAPTPSYLIGLGEENVMEDLQLAAELGKTLLERNRELEGSLRQQQAISEDRLQEIEYLSKQTAALREVNDSRLRIYEQLEVSIQELEKNNQRLSAESVSDKRKIKSLTSALESLETRCEDLQRQLQQQQQQHQLQQQQQQQRGRSKRKNLILEDQQTRRSQSCEAPNQNFEEEEEEEMRLRLEETEERVRGAKRELEVEVRKREELEIQLNCLTQENAVLQEQLNVLRERDEGGGRCLEDELASLEDSSSSRLCRKCLGEVETASNPTLYDLTDSIEDTDASIESVHGECALIRLKNGGYAWGSQESLASIGQVIGGGGGSGGTSPGYGGTEASGDGPHNSLLSELDTSYRILIEKYEALLEAREQQQEKLAAHDSLIHPGIDEFSGPMSLVMTDNIHDRTITDDGTSGKCHRCKTCTCDIKASDPRPKSNLLEEFSEVETSSSGFSDGESRLSNKSTQTSGDETCEAAELLMTPTPKCLDLSSPVNPCDKRFQAAPEYKKLFQEIFTVLKKTVDENDGKDGQNQQQLLQQHILQQQSSKTNKAPQEQEEITVISTAPSTNDDTTTLPKDIVEESGNAKGTENSSAQGATDLQVENTADSKEKMAVTVTEEFGQAQSMLLKNENSVQQEKSKKKTGENEGNEKGERQPESYPTKPLRPDSLDLISNQSGSRPSSRQRKKRSKQTQKLRQAQASQLLDSQNFSLHAQLQQRHHSRRDMREHHHHHHHHQPPPQLKQDDFPNLDNQNEGESGSVSKTRVFYNSRGRCEHHRSRKNRDRRQQQQQQPDSSESSVMATQSTSATVKISYPSVEVAKLRKLEMTYAEALKNSMSRSHYNKRY